MQTVLSEAAAMFHARVQSGPSRQTALRSIRAKQTSAQAAVLLALPDMLVRRGVMQRKKAGNTSPSARKKASQSGMSEYELRRQRNMSANRSMLRALGLA